MGLRETATRLLLGTEVDELREAQSRLSQTASVQTELLQERIIELEQALDGWTQIDRVADYDFSKAALDRIVRRSRLMYLSHPLIKRAVNVQAYYVWALGVNIQAKHPEINDVVQAFLDDHANQVELTSHKARIDKERVLQTDGNVFLVLFTNFSTGKVTVRSIPVEQITEPPICNPEDAKDPWYYKREWTQRVFDPSRGTLKDEHKVAYYPDVHYTPKPGERPPAINGNPVHWDSPIRHLRLGGLSDMAFGVPDVYAALPWAMAYQDSLEDDATRSRALARWAYRVTTPPKAVANAKARLNTTITNTAPSETNPPPLAGATFVGSEEVGLDPIKLSGAVLPTDHSRPLRLMVAAGTGTPDTILSGDADVGNLATAKTLDRPTELQMVDRQTEWANTFRELLDYQIDWAIRAPNGALTHLGMVATNGEGRDVVVMAIDDETGEPIDRHVDVDFPDLLERDIAARVKAVVDALTAGGHPILSVWPPRMAVKLLLTALGVDDIDEELDAIFGDGDDGEASPESEIEADRILTEVAKVVRAKLSTNGQHA